MPFPNLPGIPPLLNNNIAAVTTFAAPAIQGILDSISPKWGIYDSTGAGGVKVIDPDSFLGIEYVNQQNISNYPIEKGSFASYNKVQSPFNANVQIAKGGTEAARAEFLTKLESLARSTDLYTLVTPEKTYFNVSIERFDFRRSSTNGAGMIVANVNFVEIRRAAIKTIKTVASGTAQPTVSLGQQQAK